MFVHSSRIKKQIEYIKSKGINPEPAYRLAKTTHEEVLNPEKTFSFEQFHSVMKFAIEQTGDDFYGLHMGQEPHIAGTVGMMAASCKNLKEAFIQGCKFFKIQGDFAEISFVDDIDFPKIEYKISNAWKLKFPETARHEVDAMFAFLAGIMKINSNNTVKPYRINFTRRAPGDNSVYEELFDSTPFYERESDEMIFRQQDLLIPMKAFNPETFQLLKSHIESQLKRFNNQVSLIDKVKSILLSSMQYNFPDMEMVATKLKTSPRTLQRQLSKENSSFKDILKETRFDLARQMLKQNNLTVSEISYTLGYSDLGNFSRSFKKFTGVSPQEFRNKCCF
ncbi:MAG: AraC family transcriptional regulator ligand-binding domain-containing protein [Prolixibacteraceae bacterium]|nr:AraC family transcriptional regulator ligand-binding domain-containing protein [Prolixibacteraceae bacterium]